VKRGVAAGLRRLSSRRRMSTTSCSRHGSPRSNNESRAWPPRRVATRRQCEHYDPKEAFPRLNQVGIGESSDAR